MTSSSGQWVRGLHIEPERVVDAVCSLATLRDIQQQVGVEPVEWAVATALDVTHVIAAENPLFGTNEAILISLRHGVESAVLGMLASLDLGEGPQLVLAPETQRAIHEYVRRQIPLPRVWSAIRHGHALLADRFMRECTLILSPSEQADALKLVSENLFNYVNWFIEAVGEEYVAENERWLSHALFMREATVKKILSGKKIDPSDASQTLRYELEGRHHRALTAWLPEDAAGCSISTLQKIVHQWFLDSGAEQVLVVPNGESSLWAWGNSRTSSIETTTTDLCSGEDVRLAVGEVGRGVAGFQQSHSDAEHAERVRRATPPNGPRITFFSDVSLLTLITCDRSLAQRFVQNELGEMANNNPQMAELRRTVRSYLGCHSPGSTAADMQIVRNTVAYRLRRAEELRGSSLSDRHEELLLAIILADEFGLYAEPKAVGNKKV